MKFTDHPFWVLVTLLVMVLVVEIVDLCFKAGALCR